MICGSSLSDWSGGMVQQRRQRRALQTPWLRGSWTPRAQILTRARALPQKLLPSMHHQQAHAVSWPAEMGCNWRLGKRRVCAELIGNITCLLQLPYGCPIL